MWQTGDQVLGVLGGMGPLATQLFYRFITERTQARVDQEHIEMLLISHSTMPDRTGAILSGQTEPLFKLLLHDAQWLEANGATALAIPCNTSHYFASALQKELTIPLLNMVRATVEWIAAHPDKPQRVGLLATEGTIRSGLYQTACDQAGLTPVTLSEAAQAAVTRLIYQAIKAGQPIDRADFDRIKAELQDRECAAAILGCTELSILKEQYRLPDFYVDALQILADRSIEMCGRTVRPGLPGTY